MLVAVREHHIERGKCKTPERCMIAVAIKEADPDVTYIRVRTNGITLTRRPDGGPAMTTKYAVPTKAARAIISFDSGEEVRPFTFNAKEIETKPSPVFSEERRKQISSGRKLHSARVKAGKSPPNKPKIDYRTRIAGV